MHYEGYLQEEIIDVNSPILPMRGGYHHLENFPCGPQTKKQVTKAIWVIFPTSFAVILMKTKL